MPTYEYVCEKCGHEFEIHQRISAEPLKKCTADQCPQKKWGHGRVRRKISAGGGLLFKGSGFYGTDYRSDNYKQDAKNAVSESHPPAKPEAKPDAKPPAKAGAKPPATSGAKKPGAK
jgi:putative FmdB family regulatory protein